MKKRLAKTNGLELEIHSEIVSKTALILLNKTAPEDVIKRYEKTIINAALLHDIGKLTVRFQKFLNKEIEKPGLNFLHNEVGWALLSKYLSDSFDNKDIIVNSAYWHHGIMNEVGKHTDSEILNSLDEESINQMLEYLVEYVGIENINEDVDSLDSIICPLFYNLDTSLPSLSFCRSIITTADRISSSLKTVDEVTESIVDDYFRMTDSFEITKCKYDGTARYLKQQEIIIKTTQSTIINAPAGFGKTIEGLLWALRNNKKLMWVTPRNLVAEASYKSILNELDSLYIKPRVQLIIEGVIEQTNSSSKILFDADIVVTNIDNFIGPTFKNEIMDSSNLIFGCNVVIDEYHEFITTDALMNIFFNIMRVRHRLTTSETLLLSATPIECAYNWDIPLNKTTILPAEGEHYDAIHNDKYLIRVLTEWPKITPNTNSLVIKNTIKYAQEEKRNGEYPLLLHSQFLKEKKEKDFDSLIASNGKNSEISNTKPNVIGTHVVQASLDISFNHLFEDVISPQSTLQRGGRINREGTCIGESTITIIKQASRGNLFKGFISAETKMKNLLYTKELSDAWFNFMLPYNNQWLTQNELYKIYNDFQKKYKKQIREFVKGNYDESRKRALKIYPIKFNNTKENNNVITAGCNLLRGNVNDEEKFYIMEATDGKWVGPFSKDVKDFKLTFDEYPSILKKMFEIMEKIMASDNPKFNYSEILLNKNTITLDDLRKLCKKSDTPYIDLSSYYDYELGVAKYKNIKRLN